MASVPGPLDLPIGKETTYLALIAAIYVDDDSLVKDILRADEFNLSWISQEFGNIMVAAGHAGSIEVLRTLFRFGTDNREDHGRIGGIENPLDEAICHACAKGGLEIVRFLFKMKYEHAKPNLITAIMGACHSDNPKLVRWFLRRCPNASSEFQIRALVWAIKDGSTGVVGELLDTFHFDINGKISSHTSQPETLLEAAILYRGPRMCEFLIQRGADPSVIVTRGDLQESLLHVAARLQDTAKLKVLLSDSRVDINYKRNHRLTRTVAAMTLFAGHYEVFRFLMDRGAMLADDEYDCVLAAGIVLNNGRHRERFLAVLVEYDLLSRFIRHSP